MTQHNARIWLNRAIIAAGAAVVLVLLASTLLQGNPVPSASVSDPFEPLTLARNAYLAEVPRYSSDAWAQWRDENPGQRATYPTHVRVRGTNADGDSIQIDTELLGVSLDQQGLIWAPPRSAGHFLYSARPGEGSNIVIVGHSGSGLVFDPLLDIQPGAHITLTSAAGDTQYTVTNMQVIAVRDADAQQLAENLAFVEPTATEQVTLITCWPRDEYTHRLIVQAVPDETHATP